MRWLLRSLANSWVRLDSKYFFNFLLFINFFLFIYITNTLLNTSYNVFFGCYCIFAYLKAPTLRMGIDSRLALEYSITQGVGGASPGRAVSHESD